MSEREVARRLELLELRMREAGYQAGRLRERTTAAWQRLREAQAEGHSVFGSLYRSGGGGLFSVFTFRVLGCNGSPLPGASVSLTDTDVVPAASRGTRTTDANGLAFFLIDATHSHTFLATRPRFNPIGPAALPDVASLFREYQMTPATGTHFCSTHCVLPFPYAMALFDDFGAITLSAAGASGVGSTTGTGDAIAAADCVAPPEDKPTTAGLTYSRAYTFSWDSGTDKFRLRVQWPACSQHTGPVPWPAGFASGATPYSVTVDHASVDCASGTIVFDFAATAADGTAFQGGDTEVVLQVP